MFKSVGKYTVTVDDYGIAIEATGFQNALLKGMTGTKQIPFSSVTTVQFKLAGAVNGYIQFSVLGGNEAKGGVTQAAYDENSIMYRMKEQELANRLKKLVEGKIREAQASKESPPQNVKSIAEQIREFKELLDLGAISHEEYDKKKSQLLGL